MVDNESVDKICERIIDDGEKEIASILEKAQRTAAEILQRAGNEGDRVGERILKEAEEKGGIARRRLLSSVNLEVKRAKLKAREEIITGIYERMEKALGARRKHGGYAGELASLAAEALRVLEGGRFQVYADRSDLTVLRDRVFPELEKIMEKEGRGIESLEAIPLERPTLGGVRVGAPGGKVVFDNTFEARIYRLRERIRSIIFDEVFTEKGSEDSGSA